MIRAAVARTVAVLLVAAAWSPRPVRADAVVGTGTASSCTEAALNAALGCGGNVTFNCGARDLSTQQTYFNNYKSTNGTTSASHIQLGSMGMLDRDTATSTPLFTNTPTATPTPYITITSPAQYFTRQRNGICAGGANNRNACRGNYACPGGVCGSYTADIPITGTCISGAAVQCSFNGGSYAPVGTCSAGVWSGTLSAQPQGQGTLTCRFTAQTSVTATVPDVTIGPIACVGGQSNGCGRAKICNSGSRNGQGCNDDSECRAGTCVPNYQTATAPPALPSLVSTKFYHGAWSPLTDPTCDWYGEGSPWPDLGTRVMAGQGLAMGVINVCVGSTSFNQWEDGGPYYNFITRAVAASGSGGCEAVILYLGENNAEYNICTGGSDWGTLCTSPTPCPSPSSTCDPPTTNYIETTVDGIATAVHRDFGAMLLPIQPNGSTYIDTIRVGIQNVWDTSPIAGGRIAGGITMYDIPPYWAHYMRTVDLETIAARTYVAWDHASWGGTDGRGPILSHCDLLGDQLTITCTYADDTLPLRPSGALTASAWCVTDNGNTYAPSSVAVTASAVVTLTMGTKLTGTGTTVTYGHDDTAVSVTIPRDSSADALPAQIIIGQVVTPQPTLTPTQTATPQPTAMNTQASDSDGCSMTPGASADGSMLWLLIPAALVAWRRQAGKASRW